MTKSALPYSSATSGRAALDDVQGILRRFGASKCGVMEDFEAGTITLQFEYRGRQVQAQASAKGYAALWLRENPWSQRRSLDRPAYEKQAIRQGMISVQSILRDWIKGQVMAIECGIISFEGAFLGQILLPNGETVLERVTNQSTGLLPPARSDT